MKKDFFIGMIVGAVLGITIYKYLEYRKETPIYDFDDFEEFKPEPVQNKMPEVPAPSQVVPQEEMELDYDVETQKRYDEGKQMTDEYYENRNLPPAILTIEEAANLPPSVSTEIITYYYNDTILADEHNEIINDEPRLFGDCLKDFVEDKNQKTLFVMNYRLNILYEVTKTYDEYEA